MRHRARKIRDGTPERYQDIANRFVNLSKESARKQSYTLLKELEKTKTHKIGTRVRVKRIQQFAYHFAHYVYPNFIEGNAKSELKEILSSFWRTYIREIAEYCRLLDDQQILWLIELAELSKEVGVKLDKFEISILRMEMAKRYPPRSGAVSNRTLLEELYRDIKEWETRTLEFKKRATSDSELAEAIAAFATANPGRIYIGIKPNRVIEGVEINADNGKDSYQQRIARITNDVVKPKVRAELHFIVTETKKTVVRIDIPKGIEPVYYADYRPYIRYLSQTKKMEPSEVKEIYESYFRVKETSAASANF